MSTQGDRKSHVIVIGGNGYVGSHVCQEALKQGLTVSSINRSGAPKDGAWVSRVNWIRGDVLEPAGDWTSSLDRVGAVISCVGGFGSNEWMQKINGDSNINVARAAREHGVPRFVFVSAHQYHLPEWVLKGYFQGKRRAESVVREMYGSSGTILQPGFIHGTRQVKGFSVPLWLIGAPLEAVTRWSPVQMLGKAPLIGPLIAPAVVPPIGVDALARVAVAAATKQQISGTLDWKAMSELDKELKQQQQQ